MIVFYEHKKCRFYYFLMRLLLCKKHVCPSQEPPIAHLMESADLLILRPLPGGRPGWLSFRPGGRGIFQNRKVSSFLENPMVQKPKRKRTPHHSALQETHSHMATGGSCHLSFSSISAFSSRNDASNAGSSLFVRYWNFGLAGSLKLQILICLFIKLQTILSTCPK